MSDLATNATPVAAGRRPSLAAGLPAGWSTAAVVAGAWIVLILVSGLHRADFLSHQTVLAVSFTALAWLVFGSDRLRAAFAAGWWFGAGFFAAGLYWLANALLVDAARFGWMVPFAVGGMAAGLGFFPAVACALARAAAGREANAVPRVLWFALAWVALEWLRGTVLTGFPWNLIGTVWMFSDAMIQPAAWTGVHGLSLATTLLATLPAALGWHEADGRRTGLAAAGVFLGGLLVWFAAAERMALTSRTAGVFSLRSSASNSSIAALFRSLALAV